MGIVVTMRVLIIILLVFAVQPAFADHVPRYWDEGQTIPVEFRGWSEEEKEDFISYAKSRLDPLGLDIYFDWDTTTIRPDLYREGILMINQEGTTTVCAKTSTSFNHVAGTTYITRLQTIRLDITCDGYTRAENRIYWLNVMMHEFIHALWVDHIKYIAGRMPTPLLATGGNLTVRRSDLIFTYNDAWQLHQKYHRNVLVRSKVVKFKKDSIGKYCYLIQGDNSVSFVVKSRSMRLSGLRGQYKRVVK